MSNSLTNRTERERGREWNETKTNGTKLNLREKNVKVQIGSFEFWSSLKFRRKKWKLHCFLVSIFVCFLFCK